MTRLTSIAALLFALVALPGCPDDNPATNDDMAISTGDMAVGPDMRVKADSCAGVLACLAACTPANEATCAPACVNAAMNNVATLGYLNQLQTCQGAHCLPDAGTQCSMGSTNPTCQACVVSNCPTQLSACQAH